MPIFQPLGLIVQWFSDCSIACKISTWAKSMEHIKQSQLDDLTKVNKTEYEVEKKNDE